MTEEQQARPEDVAALAWAWGCFRNGVLYGMALMTRNLSPDAELALLRHANEEFEKNMLPAGMEVAWQALRERTKRATQEKEREQR